MPPSTLPTRCPCLCSTSSGIAWHLDKQYVSRRCAALAHQDDVPACPRRPRTAEDTSPDALLPIVATPGACQDDDRALGLPSPERAYFVDEGPPVRTACRAWVHSRSRRGWTACGQFLLPHQRGQMPSVHVHRPQSALPQSHRLRGIAKSSRSVRSYQTCFVNGAVSCMLGRVLKYTSHPVPREQLHRELQAYRARSPHRSARC